MKNLIILFVASGLTLISCSDSGDSPTSPPPDNDGGDTTIVISFASDIAPLIIANGCLSASCHGSGGNQGGLTLGSGTYSDITTVTGTNGAIIVDSSAATSNFYLKLTLSPPFGSRMPLGGTPLSTTNLNKIRDWINQGALDN